MKKIFLYIASLALLVSSCNESAKKAENNNLESQQRDEKVKVILDLDTGIDDAMALAYAVANPEIELLGVVSIYGNVSMATSMQNSLDLLDMLGRSDVPVFKGAAHAQDKTKIYEASKIGRFIHGDNGLGNVKIAHSSRKAEEQDGVDFMIESAKKYGKNLKIVAVGPMTNINAALKKEPKLKEMTGGIVIMGGALIVEGNINHYAEANIFQDPKATDELFQSKMDITMVGLDVTQRTNLTNKDTQTWRDLGTTSGKAFADIVDYYIQAYKESAPELEGCALHDPLAVAVAVHPEFVSTLPLHMKVGTTEADWGRTIANNGMMNEKNPNVEVCVDVKHKEFVEHFMKNMTRLFSEH